MNNQKKVALYVRANTPDEIALQKLELLMYTIGKGYIITACYSDIGNTCSTLERPKLAEMMSDAPSDKFDTVIFISTDRLARQISVLEYIKTYFGNCNTQLENSRHPLGVTL